MLLCISNLVIYNMELISYLLPWNLEEKGGLDLNPLVAYSLMCHGIIGIIKELFR